MGVGMNTLQWAPRRTRCIVCIVSSLSLTTLHLYLYQSVKTLEIVFPKIGNLANVSTECFSHH